jgi:hypothetical protein
MPIENEGYFGGAGTPPELEGDLGRTPPAPDPATEPPEQKRRGESGRVSMGGFISWDETNPLLTGLQGLKVFDEMWRTDADVKRNMLAAWSPIQTASWGIQPWGGDQATTKDKEAADLCKWALWNFMKPNFLGHLEEVGPLLMRSGYIDFEEIWTSAKFKGKEVVVPRKLDLRLPKTIWKFFEDEFGYLTGVTQFLPQKGQVFIPANSLIHYRLQPEGNNWIGTSLLRHCYIHWYMKTRFERIDAVGEERKAVGFPIIYPAQNADDETKMEVETVVANAHTNPVSYIMMPGPKSGTVKDENIGWLVDVIQFDSSSGKSVKESIELQSQNIASGFLADFLELGHHNVGARATADVQEDPFLTAVAGLAIPVKNPLDELIEKIAYHNIKGLEGPPSLTMSIKDQSSISEIAEYVSKLAKEGLITPDKKLERYLREKANLPPHDPATALETSEKQETLILPSKYEVETETIGNKGNKPYKNKKGGAPAKESVSPGTYQEEGDENKVTKNVSLDSPTLGEEIKWYEELIEQGRLKEALDGASENLIKAAAPAATQLAIQAATRAQIGRDMKLLPPADLTKSITSDMERLYNIGYATSLDEFKKQHSLRNESPVIDNDEELSEDQKKEKEYRAGIIKTKKRARIASQHITNEVVREVEQQNLTENNTPLSLQRKAELIAANALKKEAKMNAPSLINDGRKDAAIAVIAALALKKGTAEQVHEVSKGSESYDTQKGLESIENIPEVKGIYSSILDGATCDPCSAADDGIEREPEDPALTVPNPECNGGGYCRCVTVWVLSGTANERGIAPAFS